MEDAIGLAAAPGIIAALIELLKRSSVGRWVQDRDWPLAAVVLGIAYVAALRLAPETSDATGASAVAVVLFGVVTGLSASGLYSAVRSRSG